MPEVKRLDIAEQFFTGSFLTVNLIDGQEFKAEEFDQTASLLTNRAEDVLYKSGIYIYGLKHIVIEDMLYGFYPNRLDHIHALDALRLAGIQGKLQSAGKVEGHPEKGILNRAIYDWSFSLSAKELLSREDSDKYKMTVIQTAVGDFFKIR